MSFLSALGKIGQTVFDPKNHSGIGNLGKGSAGMSEEEARAKQLELLQQQLEDARAARSQNVSNVDSLTGDLFGSMPSGASSASGPSSPAGAPSGGSLPVPGTAGVPVSQAGSMSPGEMSGRDFANSIQGLDNPLPQPGFATPDLGSAPFTYSGQQVGSTGGGGAGGGGVSAAPTSGSLTGAYATADAEDRASNSQYQNALAGIKDPSAAAGLGDLSSEAALSGANPEDVAAQTQARDKLWGLTDTNETPQEKLMREIARRKQEGQLKSDREAMKNDLQARGVYGSGAEIGTQLGSQQEQASRRMMEELGADANAQARSMDALGKYGDLASSMRTSGAGESQFRGTAADKMSAFNQGIKEQHNQFVTKTEQDTRDAQERRAGAGFNANRLTTGGTASRADDVAGKKIQLAGVRAGVNSPAASQGPTQQLANYFGGQADVKHAEGDDSSPFGMIKSIFK